MCSPDDNPPLESISSDDKLRLLEVGDGSDCGPTPSGEEGRKATLKWLTFDDELNPVAPAFVVANPFIMGISVFPVVVDPLVVDITAPPGGSVWSGRTA